MGVAHRTAVLLAMAFVIFSAGVAQAQYARVAAYNIQFFSTGVIEQGDRLDKLKQVISGVNADVYAIQEVADRAALELLFPPSHWQIVIDDDSPDEQDVATVVRRPFAVLGIESDLDADDGNFIGSGDENEEYFPNRRDGLIVEVQAPQTSATFTLVNIHAKSRLGGRHVTDLRREGAALFIAGQLKTRLAGSNCLLLGDFNDNPDDRSLNILETGDSTVTGGAEEADGSLLINLMEPLAALNMVSEGASEHRLDLATGLLNIAYPGSRERNNKNRGKGYNTGPILFDQILASTQMKDAIVPGSVAIFRDKVALQGPGRTRPSDHLPVYADIDLAKLPAGKGAKVKADDTTSPTTITTITTVTATVTTTTVMSEP